MCALAVAISFNLLNQSSLTLLIQQRVFYSFRAIKEDNPYGNNHAKNIKEHIQFLLALYLHITSPTQASVSESSPRFLRAIVIGIVMHIHSGGFHDST